MVWILDASHPCASPLAHVSLHALESCVGDVEGFELTSLVLGAEAPGAVPRGRKSAGRLRSLEIYEPVAFSGAVLEVPREVCRPPVLGRQALTLATGLLSSRCLLSSFSCPVFCLLSLVPQVLSFSCRRQKKKLGAPASASLPL